MISTGVEGLIWSWLRAGQRPDFRTRSFLDRASRFLAELERSMFTRGSSSSIGFVAWSVAALYHTLGRAGTLSAGATAQSLLMTPNFLFFEILRGDGWIIAGHSSCPTADSALSD